MQPVPAAEAWNLPVIHTTVELAAWLDLAPNQLAWFADLQGLCLKAPQPLRHYRYRVLQKDSASIRLIEAPKPRLKEIQRRILTGILDHIPLHDAVHGFRKGRSIQTFCVPHVGQQTVLKMDLQDFFPSISGVRIQSLFRTIGYPETVADLLGALCTIAAPQEILHPLPRATQELYGRPHLPQGAPTSPSLANLCAYHVDCRLRGLADSVGASYTRYADDLAISGNSDFSRCANRLMLRAAAIVSEEGFAVHHRKTRIMHQSVRQQLAGLVVNERINLRRNDYDELKALLTNCVKLGPASQNRDSHPQFRQHLEGRVAFVAAINPGRAKKLATLLHQIKWETEQ